MGRMTGSAFAEDTFTETAHDNRGRVVARVRGWPIVPSSVRSENGRTVVVGRAIVWANGPAPTSGWTFITAQ